MKLTENQIEFIKNNEWMILATASKDGMPRAAVIIPSRVEADRIIISNVQMSTTDKNILENPRVFINSYDRDMNRWLKISATTETFSNGVLFDEIKKFEVGRDVEVKSIIIAKPTHIESGSEND